MARKKEDEVLSAYVSSMEGEDAGTTMVNEVPEAKIEPVESPLKIEPQRAAHGDPQVRENLGYVKVPVDSLPTMGLFYPEGLEIRIRAARGEEIKHWSTMNDEDINQIARTDDILNYMMERCCSVKNPERPGNCWQDLKSVDRFYILLAIKEFTFIKGENQLTVPSEDGDIVATKDMIDFIDIPQEIMEFYNASEKCFVFPVAGRSIKMHVPSLGVNAWLKNYAINKTNSREPFDQDFMTYAPFLIKDHRNLTHRTYEDFVSETRLWGVNEWSIVSYVTNILTAATEPKIKYVSEGGSEKEIPLNFRGGIRSIFVISNPLRAICRS